MTNSTSAALIDLFDAISFYSTISAVLIYAFFGKKISEFSTKQTKVSEQKSKISKFFLLKKDKMGPKKIAAVMLAVGAIILVSISNKKAKNEPINLVKETASKNISIASTANFSGKDGIYYQVQCKGRYEEGSQSTLGTVHCLSKEEHRQLCNSSNIKISGDLGIYMGYDAAKYEGDSKKHIISAVKSGSYEWDRFWKDEKCVVEIRVDGIIDGTSVRKRTEGYASSYTFKNGNFIIGSAESPNADPKWKDIDSTNKVFEAIMR